MSRLFWSRNIEDGNGRAGRCQRRSRSSPRRPRRRGRHACLCLRRRSGGGVPGRGSRGRRRMTARPRRRCCCEHAPACAARRASWSGRWRCAASARSAWTVMCTAAVTEIPLQLYSLSKERTHVRWRCVAAAFWWGGGLGLIAPRPPRMSEPSVAAVLVCHAAGLCINRTGSSRGWSCGRPPPLPRATGER
jgi:hypothetical protein